MPALMTVLKSQTNHSAIMMLAILLLLAKIAGVSPVDLGQNMLEVVATLGTLSGIARLILPGQVDVPPGAVVVTPPSAAVVAEAVEAVVEGKAAPGPADQAKG